MHTVTNAYKNHVSKAKNRGQDKKLILLWPFSDYTVKQCCHNIVFFLNFIHIFTKKHVPYMFVLLSALELVLVSIAILLPRLAVSKKFSFMILQKDFDFMVPISCKLYQQKMAQCSTFICLEVKNHIMVNLNAMHSLQLNSLTLPFFLYGKG